MTQLPHQDVLACPDCGAPVTAASGELACTGCTGSYPIVDAIPRFVSAENYAAGFGFQWNRFAATQLDSRTGLHISADRFFRTTGWTPEALEGKLVLDVGCGAGRFTEIALSAGARVVALDYSNAVDALARNLGTSERLLVVQGDVLRLPFRPAQFDFVYCLGVLQHTPDVRASFQALPRMLCSGGSLAVDVYPKLLRNFIWPKYLMRPFTKRLPPSVLFPVVEQLVRILLPLSRRLGRLPRVGRQLRHALPVVNYEGVYPLSETQLHEWSVLDTFDMLAPAHDHPQSRETLAAWFAEAGLEHVKVFRDGFLIGRGSRASINA